MYFCIIWPQSSVSLNSPASLSWSQDSETVEQICSSVESLNLGPLLLVLWYND